MNIANNIICISPNGKKFYSTMHWLKQFFNMLNGEYKEIESEIIGVFDGESKGKHKVLQFQDKPLKKEDIDALESLINKGGVVEFKNWKFQLN